MDTAIHELNPIEVGVDSDRGAPLRIALVHAADHGGGAERSVIGLHRGLRALGHESTLFVGARQTDEAGVQEIEYVRGAPGLRRTARALERMTGLQDIYNPSFGALANTLGTNFDVIHFNSLWGSAGFADISALPALTRRVPGVITMRENWLITGHCACFHGCTRWRTGCGACPDLNLAPAIPRDATRLNFMRKRWVIKRSQVHIVAISDWLKRQAQASPILAGKAISRIYNGIDLRVFAPADERVRRELRAALGYSPDDVVVLLAGQTVEGVHSGIAARHAIAALNSLPLESHIRPLIIGNAAAAFQAQLRLPGVTLPFQQTATQMAACFHAADLTLVTSETEAFGRIGAESQACAVPVVAFDTGGIPEVVSGGIVVPFADCAALVQALSTLAADRTLHSKLRKQGAAHVLEHFDQNRVAALYAALYRRMQSSSQRAHA